MPVSPSPALDLRTLKARALRLLAQRDHARAELERKLLTRLRREAAAAALAEGQTGNAEEAAAELGPGTDADTATDTATDTARSLLGTVLDELEAKGFLSDQRAAEALVNAKAGRFGSRRMAQVLQARALPPALVNQALDTLRSTELDRALDVWRRKFGQAPADLREKARQQRFLAGRGFDAGTIAKVLRLGLQAQDIAIADDAD